MTYQPQQEWMEVSEAPVAPAPKAGPTFAQDDRLLVFLVAAALLLGTIRHVFIGGDLPIWFDELFSAAIADEPDFRTFVTACLHELSGPVYYGILWSWAKVAGISNEALRFPSIVFSLATPLIILRWGHPDRRIRMIWAAIIALLLPISYHAGEARPYALIIMLATGQAIALSALLRRPSSALLLLWSSLSALMLMTHYFTVVVTGLQAMLILMRCRAVLGWRSLLPFVPAAAWTSVHFATVIAFIRPGVSFYSRLPFSGLGAIPDAMVGTPLFGATLIFLIAGTSLWSLLAADLKSVRDAFDRWDVATAGTGAVAVMIVTAAAMIHPCFTPRYLLPFLPACMFGVAIWANAWSRRIALCGVAIVLTFLMLAGREMANHAIEAPPGPYASLNFAAASRYITTAHPRRLVFFWGSSSAGGGTALFREVAGFELKRAGHPVAVAALIVSDPKADPNRALLAAASAPGDAILWIYDSSLAQGQLAVSNPFTLSHIDPRWQCRNFGEKPIAVIACVRP